MNNSLIAQDNILADDPKIDFTPTLRAREEHVLKIIEALRNIQASNYWKVIEQVLQQDLVKVTQRLRTEKDTIEMYRLQGQVTALEKYTLENLTNQYRNELTNLREQLKTN